MRLNRQRDKQPEPKFYSDSDMVLSYCYNQKSNVINQFNFKSKYLLDPMFDLQLTFSMHNLVNLQRIVFLSTLLDEFHNLNKVVFVSNNVNSLEFTLL